MRLLFQNKTRKVSSIFRRYSIGFSLFAGIVFGLTFISLEFRNFNKNSEISKQRFIESHKHMVKDEVLKVIDYIQLARINLEDKMKVRIKERVDEAWDINNSLYNTTKTHLDKEQIKSLIKSVLRPIRFFNERGYYFIVSMDGVEELYPPLPHLEGENLLMLQDLNGHFVIKDEINIIKNQDRGFITDYWRKPGDEHGMIFPKTSYVRYFEPLDWYIGSGEYLDNIEKEIQEEVIQNIKNIRFGNDGYIFVNTFDNIAVIIDSPTLKAGDDLTGTLDPNGIDILKTERELALKPEGGFFEYSWPLRGSTQIAPKISFVKGMSDWGWMIGAGVYINEIDDQLAKERKNLYQYLGLQILIGLILFIVVLGFVFIISGKISKRLNTNFMTFADKLKEAVWSGKTLSKKDYNIEDIDNIIDSINVIMANKLNAENLLKESETRFRTILKNIPVIILILDNEFNLLSSNQETLKYFDIETAVIKGKINFKDLLIKNRVNKDFMSQIKVMDGNFREVDVNTKLGLKSQNWAIFKTEFNEVIAVGYDITELKDNQTRLKELNATKDKFFSIISHDLVGPFNSILGLSDLLIEEYNSFNDKKRLDIIKQVFNSSTSMYKMLTNLLNWANTQTGVIEYKPKDFRLNNLVEDVIKILTPQALTKSITIINNILDNQWVYADLSMTNTVIQNLVANAVKFTNPNGLIKVEAITTNKTIRISISDDGIGIKPDIIENIFTINNEKKQMGTANESGTGLGLVVCKEFVEKMNGKIWVESELGKGTTFHFTIDASDESNKF